MFKTLKNAWKIPELKKKLLFTLLIIVLYRVGANIPVPYVSSGLQDGLMQAYGGTILDFLNVLSGGPPRGRGKEIQGDPPSAARPRRRYEGAGRLH